MNSQKNRILVTIFVLLFAEKSAQDVDYLLPNKFLPWLMEKNFSPSFLQDSRALSTLISSSSHESADIDALFNTPIPKGENGSSNSFCALQLSYILSKIRKNPRDPKLFVLLDSYAKPLAGIRAGNLDWPGQESQCESIQFSPSSDDASGFTGKFCIAKWAPKSLPISPLNIIQAFVFPAHAVHKTSDILEYS